MARKNLPTKISALTLLVVFLAALFFLLALNKYVNPNVAPLWQSGATLTTKPLALDLEINSPDDGIISFNKTITISGETSPNTIVLISTPSSDKEVDSNLLGNFSQEITLNPGLNTLVISAFDNEGNSKQVKRTIYYSEEQL